MTNPLIAPVPDPDPTEDHPVPLEPSVTNPDADGVEPAPDAEPS